MAPSKSLTAVAIMLIAVGFSARAAPLFDHGGRLLQQYPTEDGYLMLTIARNLALGKGVSVSDGTIPTNGTQPLVTLLFTGAFMAAGGSRVAGVAAAQALLLLASLAAAWLVYRLGLLVFEGRTSRRSIALLGAAAWYASPLVVPHSMNCLETGVYAIAVALVAAMFLRRDRPFTPSVCLRAGVLLGAAFWIRNDAVFLILAACLVHLFDGLDEGYDAIRARFGQALIFGSISIAVALPWLAFNLIEFGHIMPVSGRAESLTGSFASNLYYLPAVIAEYAMFVLPIPEVVQIQWYAVAASTLLVVLLLPLLSLLWARAEGIERSAMVLTSIFGLGLVVFYGLSFGAYWFLARYFFPLSPLVALGWSAVALRVFHRAERTLGRAAAAIPIVMVLVVIGLHVRAYDKGKSHLHFHVVRWVEEHVPDDVWVGAVQTGTLGFFHDKTINLDGKVNPKAYEALVESRIADYVVDDTRVMFLADWTGILDWRTMPRIDESFEVVVADYENNLGVLRRRTATSSSAAPGR
jgi:hypothetical protein